jgi:hypothetical protein
LLGNNIFNQNSISAWCFYCWYITKSLISYYSVTHSALPVHEFNGFHWPSNSRLQKVKRAGICVLFLSVIIIRNIYYDIAIGFIFYYLWHYITIWNEQYHYRGSWRGGRIPISQPKFWQNPIVPEHKSHHLSGCPAQILIPFPFSIVSLLMNPSPSAWNPIFPPKNKQIQFPFYPFRTLIIPSTRRITPAKKPHTYLKKKR